MKKLFKAILVSSMLLGMGSVQAAYISPDHSADGHFYVGLWEDYHVSKAYTHFGFWDDYDKTKKIWEKRKVWYRKNGKWHYYYKWDHYHYNPKEVAHVYLEGGTSFWAAPYYDAYGHYRGYYGAFGGGAWLTAGSIDILNKYGKIKFWVKSKKGDFFWKKAKLKYWKEKKPVEMSEPGTLGLFGAALLVTGLIARRRKAL